MQCQASRDPICTVSITTFLSGKVLLGYETLHHFEAVDNPLVSKREMRLFLKNAISMHKTDRKPELAALGNTIHFVEETSMAAP